MKIKINSSAPTFALLDQNGQTRQLSDYKGKNVLLYFYPKDNTPGCIKEACAIRDAWAEFKRAGIVVLGVSVDTVASHQKFAAKYKLPFTLLADEDKTVVKAYGVWGKKKFMGREYSGAKRISFLIDKQGRVLKIYEEVKPEEHAAEVLADWDFLKIKN